MTLHHPVYPTHALKIDHILRNHTSKMLQINTLPGDGYTHQTKKILSNPLVFAVYRAGRELKKLQIIVTNVD